MKFKDYLLIAALLGAVAILAAIATKAQDPMKTPLEIIESVPCKGNMDVSAAGQAIYCYGSDGAWVSINGAAAVQFAPAPTVAAGSITINGVQKNLPANFTIIATAPTVSAPSISASSSAPSASAPAISAQ